MQRPTGGRLAAFLLLAVVGVAPTFGLMDAYATTRSPTFGHDGGVLLTGQAAEELLAGHDPYRVSYAGRLRGSALLIDGAWVQNPIQDRYPYSPGTFLLQVPFAAPALALGQGFDPRWLYLLVYVAVAVVLARWSLRARGDLLMPLFLLGSPLSLPFLWSGETDVLLLGGLVGLAWALHRDRPVLAALALGATLAVKLLLAPFALVFLAWLAARVWRGGLDTLAALAAACAWTWRRSGVADLLWGGRGRVPGRALLLPGRSR